MNMNVSSMSQETKSLQVKEHIMFTSGYSAPLSELVAKPPESNITYSSVSVAKQEANSLEVHKSSTSASEQLPDLSSLETSDTRSHEFVSRHLSVVSEFPFIRQQLFNLFDLIPGLESCETHRGHNRKRVYALIRYNNVASAIYARNRLNGFEYPFGNRLVVTFIEDETDETDFIQEMATKLVNSELPSVIWKDNSVPQLPGSSESQIPSPHLQTDAELPSPKRKAPPDSSVRERLFIVFDPHPLPPDVLDNVLSRFGNFINVYLIPGENIVYAMFAERASASDAIAVLHGRTINGVKLKVTLADLPTEDSNKRQRLL